MRAVVALGLVWLVSVAGCGDDDVPASPKGSWSVTSLRAGAALERPIAGTELTATFAADGTLTGSGGCNRFGSTYQPSGGTMTIEPPRSTRKACHEPAGVMEQESRYLLALEKVASFERAGDQLTLKRSDGATTLVFEGAAG